MNLFQPSVKLRQKVRIGARLTRRYDAAQTPLDRVAACPDADRPKVRALQQLRRCLDPFILSQRIDQQLARIFRLATRRPPTKTAQPSVTSVMARRSEGK